MQTSWQPVTTCLPCAAARATSADGLTTGADVTGLALAGGIAAGLPWPLVLLLAAVYFSGHRKEASS